jgi:hypothetical protein
MAVQTQKQIDPVKDHVHKESQGTFAAESGVTFAGYELSQEVKTESPCGKAVKKMQQFTYNRRKHDLFLLFAVSGFQCGFKSAGKLITAGSSFIAAPVSFQQSDHFFCCSAFDEFCDRLQVAVTSAVENDVAYDVMIFQIEMDFGRTDRRIGIKAERLIGHRNNISRLQYILFLQGSKITRKTD